MSKFKLALGLHNHQPIGNFDSVFEQAQKDAYAPFLEHLKRFPQIRLSLHQSGILWEWQRERCPEYFEDIRQLMKRSQIDLLTGGFYEPILTAIPEHDVRGQIRMLTEYLKTRFHVQAQGLWLTERVWEPHLPKILSQSGIKFLPVDDTHFLYAGFQLSQLTGPFTTEHEGYTVTLLPIQKKLRYLIPFGTVTEVIANLRSQAERDPNGLAIYADDGEKFGVWPKTNIHCYQDRWLEHFFEELQNNADWLEVITLGDAAQLPSVGRAYLPSASYAEMLHWALPSTAFVEYEDFEHWLNQHGAWEKYGRYVRGSHWRGFLAKYEESNLMHKKMLSISKALAEFEIENPNRVKEIKPVQDSLYASQCNCPYWHGVFGGLYLPHLRQAVYSKMVEADEGLHQLKKDKGIKIHFADYDADGKDEILVSTNKLSAIIKPDRGGMMTELCLLKEKFNLTDTLTRRKEGYHLKLDRAVTGDGQGQTASIHDLVLAKEPDLKNFLVEDWYIKRCLIDHVFPSEVGFSEFRSGTFGEEGDFVLESYTGKINSDQKSVELRRDGFIRRPGEIIPVRIKKTLKFETDSHNIDIEYELSCLQGASTKVIFGIENNFSFQAGHANDRYVLINGQRQENGYLDGISEHKNCNGIALVDEYRGLAVAVISQQNSEIWRMPIFTVSLSEGGFEKVYQGTTIIHRYHLELSDKPIRIGLSICGGEHTAVLREAFATNAVPAM